MRIPTRKTSRVVSDAADRSCVPSPKVRRDLKARARRLERRAGRVIDRE